MMQPRVSVVIPVYNAEKYIQETVDSVLAQTYTDWELLLVNDGSTDGTPELIKELVKVHPGIRVLSKSNGGQASARNMGIREARGELIAFMDSDDLWAPSKLEDQLREYDEIRSDFMYGLGYYLHQETGKTEPYTWITGRRKGIDFFNELFLTCNVNANTVLVRKDLFDSIGFFDESKVMIGVEDLDMWMRISLHVPWIYGSEKRNIYYRLHPGGVHFQSKRMLNGRWEILKKYQDHPEVPKWKKNKQNRYLVRELMNLHYTDGEKEEIKRIFGEYCSLDTGFASRVQKVLFRMLPLGAFMWLSRNVLYRIAYRLEIREYKNKE